ncbi:MAG TPA: CopG family transcriptional regulator [Thermoanaerobaculia bacterium]|nr:CopG family transcriptional regulator [Thermoanaerobaculia bacterium]
MKRDEKPETIRTTIELPAELWRRARHRMVDDDTDLRGVIVAALTTYLGEKTTPRKEGKGHAR